MVDLYIGQPRIVIVVQDWNARALIAAQLQEEIPCRVEAVASLLEGLALLIRRAALVILDWSDQEIYAERWARFRVAARDARILILASHLQEAELKRLGIPEAEVLVRPFTVGQVVTRARQMLKEVSRHDGTNHRDQADDRAGL